MLKERSLNDCCRNRKQPDKKMVRSALSSENKIVSLDFAMYLNEKEIKSGRVRRGTVQKIKYDRSVSAVKVTSTVNQLEF